LRGEKRTISDNREDIRNESDEALSVVALVMSELIGLLHQKSPDEILARELRDTAKSIVQIKNTGH
jgi:hypothetical protein